MLNIPHHLRDQIIERWSIYNYPPLSQYAPYAAYVLTVDIFYHIALAASLESPHRPSNRMDIAYLYYLPFCMVFISSDKLHERCAKLFLRADQDFADGKAIKKDLASINQHFLKLSGPEKEEGLNVFARYPLPDMECTLNELWDNHMKDWRERAKEPYKKPEENPKLVKELREFSKAPSLKPEEIDFDPKDADMMSIQRMVKRKKGNWYQLPKDLEVRED